MKKVVIILIALTLIAVWCFFNLNRPSFSARFSANQNKKANTEMVVGQNLLFTTAPSVSPKRGDQYLSLKLPSPSEGYTKRHSLQSGPSYKVGSSCWTDNKINSVPESEKLAFTCITNQSGVDITGVNISSLKIYKYCQTETGQVLIWCDQAEDNFSGSLQLLNQEGVIVGVAALPTLPRQYHKVIESIDPVVITKDNQVFLFALNWGNRVANDSLKVDLNTGVTEILSPPTYIKEQEKCL